MSLFEGGPWDNHQSAAGAHSFSQQRKLRYGSDHDSADLIEEGHDQATYEQRGERHNLHSFYVAQALAELSDQLRRAGDAGGATVRKVSGRHGKLVWPGAMGKHHAVIESLLAQRVISVHQDDSAEAYASIHEDKLGRALARVKAARRASSDAAGQPPPAAARFSPTSAFAGARVGYVFKSGDQGLGYYLDGSVVGHVEGSGQAADSTAGARRRATCSQSAALDPTVAHILAADRAAVSKIEDDAGAAVRIDVAACRAHVSGRAGAVARAIQLIERKVRGLAFLAPSRRMQLPQLSGRSVRPTQFGSGCGGVSLQLSLCAVLWLRLTHVERPCDSGPPPTGTATLPGPLMQPMR